MKKKIEEIKEAIYNCCDEYAENREQVIRAVKLLEELEKAIFFKRSCATFYCHDKTGGDCNKLGYNQCQECKKQELLQ